MRTGKTVIVFSPTIIRRSSTIIRRSRRPVIIFHVLHGNGGVEVRNMLMNTSLSAYLTEFIMVCTFSGRVEV